MNPALLTAVAPVIPRAISLLLKAGLAVGAYVLIDKFIKDQQRKSQFNQFGNDPAIKAALEIKQALNPSGYSWLQDVDTTNTDALRKTALSIDSYKKVIDAYKKLGYGDLDEDLKKELTNEQYNFFLTAVSKEGAGIVVESPYKFKVGEVVTKKIGVNTPIMKVISNNNKNAIEILGGNSNNESQMLILNRGKLTLTSIDGSKVIENFYKVRFNNKGLFSDSIIEGWINEKYLKLFQSDAVLDKKAVPFKYSIGDVLYKKAGDIDFKNDPTEESSVFDTVLNNSDNSTKLTVVGRDRVLYANSKGEELLTNYYKVKFENKVLFFPTQSEKWVRGENLSPYKSA